MEIKNAIHSIWNMITVCNRAVRKKFNGAGKKFKAFFNAYNSNTHILMEKQKKLSASLVCN